MLAGQEDVGCWPLGPRIPGIDLHFAAGHWNVAVPTSTRAGNDHPHTSGLSFAGSSAMVPGAPRGQCSARASGGRPPPRDPISIIYYHRHVLPSLAPEHTCAIEIMVVFCCRHYRHCCYALLFVYWLVSLLIWEGPRQLAVW